jgi:hypothetical protein
MLENAVSGSTNPLLLSSDLLATQIVSGLETCGILPYDSPASGTRATYGKRISNNIPICI